MRAGLHLRCWLATTLAEAYTTPKRAYHDLRHVEELLAWFAAVRDQGPGWAHPSDVLAAVLFHDAVYVAGQADNEARSAELAGSCIAQHGLPCDVPRVVALIEATARHGAESPSLAHEATGEASDLLHFLDADMAILGAEPERFDDYERAIAEEYRVVPEAAFRTGRGASSRACWPCRGCIRPSSSRPGSSWLRAATSRGRARR